MTSETELRTALLQAGPGAALSHETAARAWGLELLDPGPDRVTVPLCRSRLLVPGWVVVRSDLPGGSVEERLGMRATTALRTVRDLARVLSFTAAVVVADSALRQELLTVGELTGDLSAAMGRGSARLRAVAGAADPGCGSVLESLLRLLLAGIDPSPLAQYEIRDAGGRFVARVDFCWPWARLVVEADGFAFHSDRVAFRHDRERLNELERLGWRVLRFTWEDVVGRPGHVLDLVRECLQQQAA